MMKLMLVMAGITYKALTISLNIIRQIIHGLLLPITREVVEGTILLPPQMGKVI
jgi:hypothetical protein